MRTEDEDNEDTGDNEDTEDVDLTTVMLKRICGQLLT